VSDIAERTSGGVTTEFGYELIGQLISETRTVYSATKHYDAFGNQTTSTGTWHGPFQYGGNFG
jgi:YD repeat-containing protein